MLECEAGGVAALGRDPGLAASCNVVSNGAAGPDDKPGLTLMNWLGGRADGTQRLLRAPQQDWVCQHGNRFANYTILLLGRLWSKSPYPVCL